MKTNMRLLFPLTPAVSVLKKMDFFHVNLFLGLVALLNKEFIIFGATLRLNGPTLTECSPKVIAKGLGSADRFFES